MENFPFAERRVAVCVTLYPLVPGGYLIIPRSPLRKSSMRVLCRPVNLDKFGWGNLYILPRVLLGLPEDQFLLSFLVLEFLLQSLPFPFRIAFRKCVLGCDARELTLLVFVSSMPIIRGGLW